jgi:hypothetical protein
MSNAIVLFLRECPFIDPHETGSAFVRANHPRSLTKVAGWLFNGHPLVFKHDIPREDELFCRK